MRQLALILAVALVACGGGDDKGGKGGKGAAAAPARPADALLDRWKGAGLSVGTFASVDGAAYGGGDCRAGQLAGVDAVVCEYATADLAKAAEAKGLAAVGAATGAALAHGTLLLVVVDRKQADREGRTIDAATRVFLGKPAAVTATGRPAAAP